MEKSWNCLFSWLWQLSSLWLSCMLWDSHNHIRNHARMGVLERSKSVVEKSRNSVFKFLWEPWASVQYGRRGVAWHGVVHAVLGGWSIYLMWYMCVAVCVAAGEAGDGGQWVKRSSLVDSRTSVTDVKFAPKHLGLQLVRTRSRDAY